MKAPAPHPRLAARGSRVSRPARRAGFTLVELIGVMAIIAILAAITIPATIRMVDLAAVRGEAETLRRVGAKIPLHLRLTGALPTAANWTTTLAPYTDLPVAMLATNPRQVARVFLLDPAASPAPRVLILSSMRQGLPLPSAAQVNTTARFQDIWQTTDGFVPPWTWFTGGTTWSGYGATAGNYLLIERVNLASELATFSATLNNTGPTQVRYDIVRPGATTALQPAPVGITTVPALRVGDRLNLYRDNTGASLGYAYTVSTHSVTLQWDGTRWTAP